MSWKAPSHAVALSAGWNKGEREWGRAVATAKQHFHDDTVEVGGKRRRWDEQGWPQRDWNTEQWVTAAAHWSELRTLMKGGDGGAEAAAPAKVRRAVASVAAETSRGRAVHRHAQQHSANSVLDIDR